MSLVADPTTGLPSRQEISYIAVERAELEAAEVAAQTALDEVNAQVESLTNQLTEAQADVVAKEASLGEAKSSVAEWDSLAPSEAVVDDGTAGDGSEGEVAVEEVTESAEVVNF
jgi:Tfp pilus assembly protein FimV